MRRLRSVVRRAALRLLDLDRSPLLAGHEPMRAVRTRRRRAPRGLRPRPATMERGGMVAPDDGRDALERTAALRRPYPRRGPRPARAPRGAAGAPPECSGELLVGGRDPAAPAAVRCPAMTAARAVTSAARTSPAGRASPPTHSRGRASRPRRRSAPVCATHQRREPTMAKREAGERWQCTCGAQVVGAAHADTGKVGPITVAAKDNGNVLVYRDREGRMTYRPVLD